MFYVGTYENLQTLFCLQAEVFVSSHQIVTHSKINITNAQLQVIVFQSDSFFHQLIQILFHLLVQKLFLPRSNFFEHVQYFLNTITFFDHGQKQDFTL